MVRWIRIIALVLVALGFVALGVVIGLYLVANWRWVPIETPESLRALLGDTEHEVWLPALLGGWLVGVLGLGVLLAWGMFYVWRRRQSEVLVRRLERELAELRNLPFKRPAPIEDLPGDDDDDELDDRGEAVAADPVDDFSARDFAVDDESLDEPLDIADADAGDDNGDDSGGDIDAGSATERAPSRHASDAEFSAGEPDVATSAVVDGARRARTQRGRTATDAPAGGATDEAPKTRSRTRTGVGD